MPTLCRILKYTPAVVLGLLVVAWVVSTFYNFLLVLEITASKNEAYRVYFTHGTILHLHCSSEAYNYESYWGLPTMLTDVLGKFNFLYVPRYPPPGPLEPVRPFTFWLVSFPLAWLVTALIPLAIGPFLSFRFRVWHYLAYTALVAVELAYYLRWQE